MKQFFVALLLAVGMLSLMIFLDLLMGITAKGIFWKTINPFRVMEPAEYVIVIFFITIFLLKSMFSYIKKKQQSNPPAN
ncbi:MULTISPECIES: hypothetical protein [Bacillaceae]|uniref:hypothetical protein n=1 Tax=Bacillaceae TaxID=186817 RepID=UPI00118907DE|nr:hypothetical protein [Bacillus sp. S3]QCJ42348.1 hypothetical protein FAY30_10750 [Bacillus sp. S3]